MEIIVRGRGSKVPESIRTLVERKLEHVQKFLSTIQTVDVEIYHDGHSRSGKGHVVEMKVATGGPSFRAKATSSDPRISMEMAAERIERKLKEFKRKRSGRPPHTNSKSKVPGNSQNGSLRTSIKD